MKTFKNFGLVECGTQGQLFRLPDLSKQEGYQLKKILLKGDVSIDTAKLEYPQAEIVTDKQDILQDKSIELVIVSSPADADMSLVGEVLKAGKHVRIV
ncbi:MAG: Gfo/Idh/MocA family oxidoreductase [Chitinophagaceae bacterium]